MQICLRVEIGAAALTTILHVLIWVIAQHMGWI